MSKNSSAQLKDTLSIHAPIFAALGDPTRLRLISKLCSGELYSIAELTEQLQMTRQAVTKHLRVLENTGLVINIRQGRESLFQYNSEPIEDIKNYLDQVSKQWDHALARLKAYADGD